MGGDDEGLLFRAFSQALMPSLWGMLVYREETSAETRMILSGNGPCLFISSIWFKKWVVSWMKEGICAANGRNIVSRKREIWTVGHEQPDTIGRPGFPVL